MPIEDLSRQPGSVRSTPRTVPEARSKEYLEALLRDPDFQLVLDAD